MTLDHDGNYFWTLQKYATDGGIVIKRWNTFDGVICKRDKRFNYVNSDYYNYVSNSMAVERYETFLTDDVVISGSVIKINEYYDSVVLAGTKLHIGPNINGHHEEVTVSGINIDEIILTEGVENNYSVGDKVHIVPSLFVFNEYYGTEDTGSLMRFDANTGEFLSEDNDSEYKGVTASIFHRFKDILKDYPDAHSLVYVKGNQAKLRDMSDLVNIYTAESRNEYFTGADYSYPDEDNWDRTGTPFILDNRLFLNTVIDGTDAIHSKYHITGDFEVQVSGSLGGYNVINVNESVFKHYMSFEIFGNSLSIGHKYSYSELWSPSEMSTSMWLDSSDVATVIVDGSNNVSQWRDKSGHDRHANQSNASYQPKYSSGAIVFNGSNNYLDCNNAIRFSGSGDYFYFIVIKPTAVTVQNYHRAIMGAGGQGTPGLNLVFAGTNLTSGGNSTVNSEHRFRFEVCDDSSNRQSVYTVPGTAEVGRSALLGCGVVDSVRYIYLDGEAGSSGTLTYTGLWGSNPFRIGRPTGGNYYAGDVYEVIAVDSFDMEDRQKIEGYLAYKWGLEDNLPIDHLYKNSPPYGIGYSVNELYMENDGIIENTATLSGSDYMFKVERTDDDFYLYYKTLVSGVFDPSWQYFGDVSLSNQPCQISLGLMSAGVTVSGAYFDDLIYSSGRVYYPVDSASFYGIMQMDNLRTNGVIIPVHDVAIQGGSLYRLQLEGTYYGTNNSWSSYNYQVSPIRSFVNSISITAYPVILPANGMNVSTITALIQDQYGEGSLNAPVFVTDDDAVGFITITPVYTDMLIKTGIAKTSYKAGVALRTVTIQGKVTQYD